MIRVLVWAKSNIARAGLEAIVQADPRFELARDPVRNIDLASSIRLAVSDVVLADLGEVPIARLLPGHFDRPAAPAVVVLIDVMPRAEVLRLLQYGTRAVLAREADPREITAALQAAYDGLTVFSPEVLETLLPAAAEQTGSDDPTPEEPLTSREIDVLALLAEGAGNKEIASRLGISEHTAKFHVSSILGKLGAASRTEAVTRGYRAGLILM